MKGTDHGLISVAGWLAAAPFVPQVLANPHVARFTHHATIAPITPGQLAAGAVLAAGAGLLPDWDHHDASAAHTFPGGPTLAHGVELATGGHRHGTHSTVAMVAAAYGGWWLAGRTWSALLVSFMLAALTLHIVPWKEIRWHAWRRVTPDLWQRWTMHPRRTWERHLYKRGQLIFAAGIAALVVEFAGLGRWLGVIFFLGVASHIAADMFNPEGWMPAWPILRFRLRVPLFRTAGKAEEVASYVFVASDVYLLWIRFV